MKKEIIKQNLTKERLTDLYLDKGFDALQIAKMYGCTKQYIWQLKNEYQIRSHNERWTPEEDVILKAKYTNQNKSTIQLMFPRRTWHAIIRRANQLRLKREVSTIEKSIDLRNITDVEKGYLVGILEGEGTLSISKYKSKQGNRPFLFHPFIRICNTNLNLINETKRILGTKLTGTYENRIGGRYGNNYKPYYAINISRLTDVLRLMEFLKDSFKSKASQCNLLIEFCKLRLSHYREPYTNREIEIVDGIRNLNKRGR